METIKSLSVKAKSFGTRLRRLSNSEGRWVTVRGRHVFVKEGQDVLDAINQAGSSTDGDARHKWRERLEERNANKKPADWKKTDKEKAAWAQRDANRAARRTVGDGVKTGIPSSMLDKDKLWSGREKSAPPFVLDVLSRHNTGEKLNGYLKSLPKEKLNKALVLIEQSGSIDAATKRVKDALSAALKDKE